MLSGNQYSYKIQRINQESALMERIRSQLKLQLWWVDSLNFPREISNFLKSVPILVIPRSSIIKDQMAKSAPDFSAEDFEADYNALIPNTVTLSAEYLNRFQSDWISYKSEKPILLEMLLMAMIDQHVPQGVNNTDIKPKNVNENKKFYAIYSVLN